MQMLPSRTMARHNKIGIITQCVEINRILSQSNNRKIAREICFFFSKAAVYRTQKQLFILIDMFAANLTVLEELKVP